MKWKSIERFLLWLQGLLTGCAVAAIICSGAVAMSRPTTITVLACGVLILLCSIARAGAEWLTEREEENRVRG